jgi:hypothetical protein
MALTLTLQVSNDGLDGVRAGKRFQGILVALFREVRVSTERGERSEESSSGLNSGRKDENLLEE